ncbi:MAG: AMP-binding protein [Thermodesulfovibrionales bacterium]|jgi:long-chain acyl-CoA synthetase
MVKKVIPEIFLKSAGEYKDKIAFNYFDREWKSIKYHELLSNTKAIASHLINSGIQKGDRVAVHSENRPEWCTAYLALSMSGGIGVPIDVQLGPNEIKNLLDDSEAKVIFHSSKTEENVKKALKQPGKPQVVQINFDSPDFNKILQTPDIGKYPDISEEDLASIIYTSGTTGKPKGVMLTHKNFCSDADSLIEAGILSHDDSVISVLPLHHTYPFLGNCILPVFLGTAITYPQSLKGPDLMAAMRDFGVTMLVSVPQLLELIRNGIFNKISRLPGPLPKIMFRILNISGTLRRKFDINLGKVVFKSVHRSLGEKFRFSACGGAKLDPQVMKDLEALGLTILEGYGLTETSPVVAFNPIEKRKPASVGKPLPSAEIKIIDPESGKETGIMREGEIIIRGPMVMKGYYKNPEATSDVLKDGWFHSGDLGYIDNDGYLFITGRIKEVIVLSSGKNIYPDEVEKQYLKIPLIKEICVMGVEEKGMIESLQAVIVPDTEYAKTAQISHIQEALKWEINNASTHLPSYMRLKGYTLYPEPLPRTPLGKIRRFMVKDLLQAKDKEQREKGEDQSLIQDEIGGKVAECIRPLLKEKIPIQATDNLELDLGLDSLAKIELVVMLEKVFSMKLPETLTAEAQTVAELIVRIKEYDSGGIRSVNKMPAWKDILTTEPPFNDRKKVGFHHNSFDRLIIFMGLQLVKIVSKIFFSLKTEGLHNIPEQGPYIITPNHASYLDAFAVVSGMPSKTFRDLYTLGIQKYFTGNAGKSFARLANVIPIDQEKYLNKALQMSSYVLRNGKSLLIFPEGGRSFDGKLMEFKKGVGILAIELNIPVIPAYIEGSFEALPRSAAWPKFRQIKVAFGKPLFPYNADMSKKPAGTDNYQFFVNELKERVKNLSG